MMPVKDGDDSQQKSLSEQKLAITSPSSLQMFPMPDSQPQTARHCSGGKCVITWSCQCYM